MVGFKRSNKTIASGSENGSSYLMIALIHHAPSGSGVICVKDKSILPIIPCCYPALCEHSKKLSSLTRPTMSAAISG